MDAAAGIGILLVALYLFVLGVFASTGTRVDWDDGILFALAGMVAATVGARLAFPSLGGRD